MRDSSKLKRKEPDNYLFLNILNIPVNESFNSFLSNTSNALGSLIKVEIKFHEKLKTPRPQEPQKILKKVDKSFIKDLTKTSQELQNEYPPDVARFIAPKTSSSPHPRTSYSQSNHGPSSSPPPAKKQKTDHKFPIDPEHERLLIEQQDRTRQASLSSENERKLAESFFYQPPRDVPTNPTFKEIDRLQAIKFTEEEKRIKRLEGRYPGASTDTLLKVYPKPTGYSKDDAHERRIKEQILKKIAERRGIQGHDSINNFINTNWERVSKELVNYVGLYGFDGAIESKMKNLSRNMTTEKAPSNRGAGRGGGRGRY
jgi:hypothetical protein